MSFKLGTLFAHASQALQQASLQPEQWGYFIGMSFLAGLLTSLLPCIYPMIPVTIGILQAQQPRTLWQNFFLAASYVSGMAIVYAILGYVSATTAVLFGSWLANPWFIAVVTLFFVYFAFSMFGFYEIYIPRFLQQRSVSSGNPSLARSFVFGMLSATVASPCVAPPLAVILTLVAQHGNPLLGFCSLLVFSFGMGFLLLIIGTFSSALFLLPKAGGWLDEMKRVLGFMLLGVAVYFATGVLSVKMSQILYMVICLSATFYYAIKLRKMLSPTQRPSKSALEFVLTMACLIASVGGVIFLSFRILS